MASNVAAWFRQPANRQLLRELAAAGMVCVDGPPAGAAAAAPAARGAAAAAAAGAAPARAASSRGSGKGSKVQAPAAGSAVEAVEEAAVEEDDGVGGDGPLVPLNGLSVCITGTLMVGGARERLVANAAGGGRSCLQQRWEKYDSAGWEGPGVRACGRCAHWVLWCACRCATSRPTSCSAACSASLSTCMFASRWTQAVTLLFPLVAKWCMLVTRCAAGP